jgi:hypothetical protein
MKSCELVVEPITGFFIFKNNQCQRSLTKQKEVETRLYCLEKVISSQEEVKPADLFDQN